MLTTPQTGRPYKQGETIKMPLLAKTFETIADDPHALYNGSLADDVVADIREAGKVCCYLILIVDKFFIHSAGFVFKVES